MKKIKKRNWRKVVGLALIAVGTWVILPMYFLPSDFEFYTLLFMYPYIGVWALIIPFPLAAVALVVGMWMLGLPLNSKGVKRAMKKVKTKKRKKK